MSRKETEISSDGFQWIFKQMHGSQMLLEANPPVFTILAASDQLLEVGMKKREEIIGKGLFEVFSGNKQDSQARQQEKDLRASFERVFKEKKEDIIPIQQFDVIDPETGEKIVKYWAPVNKPIFDKQGNIIYILHYTEEITEIVKLKQREEAARKALEERQKKMNDFFNHAPVAIALFSTPDFIVDIMNPLMSKLLGHKPEDLLHKPFFETKKELEDHFRPLYEAVLNTGKRHLGREQYVKVIKEGKDEAGFFDFTYEPVIEADGSVSGVLTIATDITHQVLFRKKIEESEKRMKFALEASKMGVWEVDLETEINTRDFRHDQIYGYSEPVKKWNIEVVMNHIHPEDRDHVKEIFEKAGEDQPLEFVSRIITPDGSIKWIEVKGKSFSDEEGKKKQFGVIADITERKTLELQKENYLILLKQYNRELEEVTKAKDNFISVISHDLRSPLSIVISSSDIIINNIENLDKAESENFLKIINNSSKKIAEQLNELVELSKSRSKNATLNPINKSLYESVNISIEMIESLAGSKKIHVRNNTPDYIFIHADPYMMQSIINNLLSNAIKFTPENGSIEVKAKLIDNGMVEIRIIDNGIGMTKELRESIFDEKKMVTTEGTDEEKGSGLGLILVKEFVKLQGGTIRVESEPGKGSCFAFTVPQARK
jgi:two-component system, OmpR family, sensor histidine kinase VicK